MSLEMYVNSRYLTIHLVAAVSVVDGALVGEVDGYLCRGESR